MLTPQQEMLLKQAFREVFRQKAVEGTIRRASVTLPNIGVVTLLEQNPASGTAFATLAQEGHKIAWPIRGMKGRRWLGPLIAKFKTGIKIVSRKELLAAGAAGELNGPIWLFFHRLALITGWAFALWCLYLLICVDD